MELLQMAYGNAGRGLVFPYQVAGTNAPFDLASESDVKKWEVQKNIFAQHDIPVGISGISLRQASGQFRLSFRVKNEQYAFNRLTLFTARESSQSPVQILGGWQAADLGAAYDSPLDPGSTVLDFSQAQTAFTLYGRPSLDKPFTLQGVMLENTQAKGILYSMIGVNGATYQSYLRSSDFFDQLAQLKPDLIIVSLGTNEAADLNLREEILGQSIGQFIKKARAASPGTPLLLSTPNNIYPQGRLRHNRNSTTVAETLHSKAKEMGCAVWDFHAVMGGHGSIDQWVKHNLAARDRIHLSQEGYQLQGELFVKALMGILK
jgi:lysophospholipase L1-like esterase